MTISDLQRFAFNQGRFVFLTWYTCERELCYNSIQEVETFEKIKSTTDGKKFLGNVTFHDIRMEGRRAGAFLKSMIEWAAIPDDDFGSYVETFKEF